MRLDGLGQALLAGQPVAVSGLALSEIAAVMYAAATEIRELQTQVRDAAQAQATETTLTGGTTMKHEFPIGTRTTLFLTACPIDDTTDGEDEHEFRDEPAVVVEHLNGDPAADYLVYVPRTRRVYSCVPADMARAALFGAQS